MLTLMLVPEPAHWRISSTLPRPSRQRGTISTSFLDVAVGSILRPICRCHVNATLRSHASAHSRTRNACQRVFFHGGGSSCEFCRNPGTGRACHALLRRGGGDRPQHYRLICWRNRNCSIVVFARSKEQGDSIEKTALCRAGRHCQCRSC